MLHLTYTISNKTNTISTKEYPDQKWLYLDKQKIQIGDYIEIYDKENDIEHNLRLYQKNDNIHIFSGITYSFGKFFSLEYPYYLVWDNNPNVYYFIQDNMKVENIKDECGNRIYLTDESLKKLFEGLFSICPRYDSETQNIDFKLPHPIEKKEVEDNTSSSGSGFISHKIITFVPR